MPSNQVAVDVTSNQITTAGYAYDGVGNMTSDGVVGYSFDASGQMTAVLPLGGGAPLTTFTYDASGLRVVKNGNIYIYSGSQVIAEYPNGASAAFPSAEHIYAGGRRIATIASGAITYHLADHLSTRADTDSTGRVIRNYGSFPFGATWYESAPDKFKFTSFEFDSESGVHYAQVRYQSPRIGRFLSIDPFPGRLMNPQSLNRFAYTQNSPINLIDPGGTCPQPVLVNDEFVFPCEANEMFDGPTAIGDETPEPSDDPSESGDSGTVDKYISGICASGPCPDAPIKIGGDSVTDFLAFTMQNPGDEEGITDFLLYQTAAGTSGASDSGNSTDASDSGSAGTEPVHGNDDEPAAADEGSSVRDLQTYIGWIGMVPGPVGEIANGVNAAIALYEGDYGTAAIYGIAALAPVGGAVLGEAAVALRETDEGVQEGMKLYRVFGGEAQGLKEFGATSFTTVNPADLENFREAAGIYPGNTGQFVIEGTLNDTSGVIFRDALPGPGGVGGGLPEVVVPNARAQITVTRVSGVNPPF
jgi:RHS repeat-associated protein